MDKELWVVAGPNGAGKTTWVQTMGRGRDDFTYLSADAIAEVLSPGSPEDAQFEAGRQFIRQLRSGLEDRKNLMVESTLSGRGIGRSLKAAKADGYRVVIVFLFLPTAELCVERVAHRVRRGGHNVSDRDIRRRYIRSRERFWRVYRYLADEWSLFYNALETFELVALGGADRVEVLNEALLSLFREGVNRED